jgi:protocatechuate 3,4-dioxygenase beta subunit
MKKKVPFILVCLLTSVILAACSPSQAERDEQATKIAASISATQTVEAPTPTNTPTPMDTPTHTPTSTLTPTDTPTPTSTPTTTPTPTPEPTPTPTPTSTITPTPTPVPSLSGRVTDAATGQGIAGATVEVRPDGGYGAYIGWEYSAKTTADGSYALFGLPTGNYVVRVTGPGYAREYYDNVTPSSDAEIVHVTALRETASVDFKLTEGGSISGRVYQSDGMTPIAGAEVFVRPGKYFQDDGFHTVTDSDGNYIVENLYLGSFRIFAGAEGYAKLKYYGGTYDWNKASNVVVTPPNDTPGIDIHLELAGSISGFVYASDGVTPIPHVSVWADITTGEFEEGFEGTSDNDGSYIIESVLPGQYTVRTSNTPNWYVAELYNSKYTWGTADHITVIEGSNTPNINFTLDEGGLVTGHVFDEDTGEPVEGIHLDAWLPDGDGTSEGDGTSYDGSYELLLKPGEHLIGTGRSSSHVLGYKYIPEWYDNAYDMSHATLVNVTLHHETSGIDIHLAKSGSISGYVYDKDGNPISDVSVYAFSDVYPGNGANTQSDGSYTIEGLLSGNYAVQVTMSGYISEYYDDVTDPGSATQVTVNAPDDTPGIDFALSPVSE